MSDRTCAVDGCESRAHAKTLCSRHYVQQRAANAPSCSVDGCAKAAAARGWCQMHYQRWRKYGDPLRVKPREAYRKRPRVARVAPCVIDGCEKVQIGRGWCSMHYSRWERLGDPHARLRGEVRDGKKICPRCHLDKPLEAYGASRAECLACAAAEMRQRRADGFCKPPPEVARVEKVCDCGAAFMADRRRSRYCSQECRARFKNRNNWIYLNKRRARMRDALVEPFDRLDIFDRDDWVCQICSNPVDPDLMFPDALSVSLDHIVPISRGGTHEPSNAQTAHLICNVRKSNKIA